MDSFDLLRRLPVPLLHDCCDFLELDSLLNVSASCRALHAAVGPLVELAIEVAERERDWNRMRMTYMTAGFTDGIEEGKEVLMQTGFNQGFHQAATQHYLPGFRKGSMAAMAMFVHRFPEAVQDVELRRQVIKESNRVNGHIIMVEEEEAEEEEDARPQRGDGDDEDGELVVVHRKRRRRKPKRKAKQEVGAEVDHGTWAGMAEAAGVDAAELLDHVHVVQPLGGGGGGPPDDDVDFL